MYELYDVEAQFPFLFGGTFIEAGSILFRCRFVRMISLPFRRDFH